MQDRHKVTAGEQRIIAQHPVTNCNQCKIFGYCMGELLHVRGEGKFPLVACVACGILFHVDTQNPVAKWAQVCRPIADFARKKTQNTIRRHDQPETDNYYGTFACLCSRPECRGRRGEVAGRAREEYFREKDKKRYHLLGIHYEASRETGMADQ